MNLNSKLEQFAKMVLRILEQDREWNKGTLDKIQVVAYKLGLANTDNEGFFKEVK